MIKRILSTALFVLATSATMLSQNVALKTNALYWATTTPNLGIEAVSYTHLTLPTSDLV